MSETPEPETFVVDLMDPADIRAKLPVARDILATKRRDTAAWEQRVKLMESFTGSDAGRLRGSADAGKGTAPPITSISDVVEWVVRVVDSAPRKIRPRVVYDELIARGLAVTFTDVQRAMELAAQQGLIQPPSARGWYAPLGYKDTEIG